MSGSGTGESVELGKAKFLVNLVPFPAYQGDIFVNLVPFPVYQGEIFVNLVPFLVYQIHAEF